METWAGFAIVRFTRSQVELRDCSPDLGKLRSRTAEEDGRVGAVADPLCWPGLANVYAWLKMPIDKMIRLLLSLGHEA